MSEPPPRVPSEAGIVALVGAVQFVNVLDFMMVMPLGPRFAESLHVPSSQLGAVASAYTFAAACSGIAGGGFLDRFDRKHALVAALAGLALGTVAGGVATDFTTLVASRLVAGAFGGPATALALAVLSDLVPPERRGVAVGKVMGAFSVASVLGVPTGIELAERFGFRAPFFAIGTLALLVTAFAARMMPSVRAHLDGPKVESSGPLLDGLTGLAVLNMACVFVGNFAIIPNFASYLQYNLGLPRGDLRLVYALGGAASFVTMRIAGGFSDRVGAAPTVALGTVSYVVVLVLLFVRPVLAPYPILGFALFMVANSARFVGLNSLGSRVPTADRRARFLSMQNAVQHVASTTGSFGATLVLVEGPGHVLLGMERLAWLAIALSLVAPGIAYVVERRVRAREDVERRLDEVARDEVACLADAAAPRT